MTIFSREGKPIFVTSDINHGWAGNYMGRMVEIGIYLYRVIYVTQDQEKVVLHGTVSMIR